EQAGILRAEDDAPPVSPDPRVVSLMATLATGILYGPAGSDVRSSGSLVDFFTQLRKWYGDNPSLHGGSAVPGFDQFNLGLSHPTHFEAFNIYVPFANRNGACNLDIPPGVPVPPPDFSRFFQASGT